MTELEDDPLEVAFRTLRAAVPALPRKEDLADLLEQVEAAQARGYFHPYEDEHLRQVYASYLAIRTSLWQVVLALKPLLKNQERYEVFGVAFCSAAILRRSASFVIGLAKDRPVVRKKLDEAEIRYGLEWKSYTRVYRSVTSIRWMWQYRESVMFYEEHRAEIQESLSQAGLSLVGEWLREEEPFFETKRRLMWRRRFAYRWYSFCRRHRSGYGQVMFFIFRLGGCAIAEMRQPFVKKGGLEQGKRVSEVAKVEAQRRLVAGDVIVTRHDDAMSNLFLPGFWPHAALYLGEGWFLEAKKDGVKVRPLRETLEVDAFLVLRPQLEEREIKEALTAALSHEGKLYDFAFDFTRSDRLVCTEVVYRTYHGREPIGFDLVSQSGRLCLPAEELIGQALKSGSFQLVSAYGIQDDYFVDGEEAIAQVEQSLTPSQVLQEPSQR